MAESHQSMRDDFSITTPEIDYLVDIIHRVLGKNGGVRMTGGGFGGCVIALAKKAHHEKIINTINTLYTEKTGLKAEIHCCIASSGAGLLKNIRKK